MNSINTLLTSGITNILVLVNIIILRKQGR